MKEMLKVTTREFKTKRTITASYDKEAFPEIQQDELKELFEKLAPLAGMNFRMTMGMDFDGHGVYMHVRLEDPDE